MKFLTLCLLLLGALPLSKAQLRFSNLGSAPTFRFSFDISNNAFYIEYPGDSTRYYRYTGMNFNTMGLSVHFINRPGTALIEPSISLVPIINNNPPLVISGNEIKYAGYGEIWAFGATVNSLGDVRSFYITITGAYTCIGICNPWTISTVDCTDMCPSKEWLREGHIEFVYTCYPCDCSCSSGSCYGPGAGMCCHSSCKTCLGPTNTQCQSCAPGYYLQPSPNAYTCSASCPIGYGANDTLAACVKCSDSQVWYNSSCLDDCPYGYTQTAQGECRKCSESFLLYYSHTCVTSCPVGYGANDILTVCEKCSNSQVWYNGSCLNACPYGYIQTAQGGCRKCSETSQIFYNHSCVNSCPLATFIAFNNAIGEYECLLCYIGCETCENSTSRGCTSCSEGFFYFNNTCNGGCPAAMHANKLERTCERCPAPCWTCSQPNTDSCTSCLPGYLLHSGTCILNCPENYYQGSYIGEVGVYEVPTCFPKLELVFNLSLTSESRVVNINFNYGIINMILAISKNIKIQIGNTEIDNVLFVLSVVAESKLRFHYLGDQYYPPLSLLNITVDLQTTDFNDNAYQRFMFATKTATIQLKEIFPFTKVVTQFISNSSALTGTTGRTVAVVQAVSSVAQRAFCLSFLWLQIVGESIQLMKFIDIRWPPNVAQFYETSYINPYSFVLPIDFMTPLNDRLDNNYSIPRVFDEYEISPFFIKNYSSELSNLAIWVSVAVIGSLIIRLSRICLKKTIQQSNFPPQSSSAYVTTINILNEFMNRVGDSKLWSFLFLFILSIYQSGNLWALLNIRFSSALLEPSTIEAKTSLALGIIFFLFNLTLLAFATKVVASNMEYYLLRKEDFPLPNHLKKYELLFGDLKSKKRIQLLFVTSLY